MVKVKRFFCYLLAYYTLTLVSFAENDPFRYNAGKNDNIIKIHHTIQKDTTFLINNKKPIIALYINGRITLNNEMSFIRILLEDLNGIEYLILEKSKMTDNKDIIELNDYCQETKYLPFVHPYKIKVFLKDVSLYIEDLCYVNNSRKDKLAVIKEKDASNRLLQAQIISDNITSYNQNKGLLWDAGITRLCLMSYEEKKRMLGFQDNDNIHGIDYYIEGIYESSPDSIYTKSDSIWNERLLNSPYVPSFDWRNRHGKNWLTSIKDQGGYSTCWAFAAIGATEALTYLYYNKIFENELDLSEQDLISCYRSTGSVGAIKWISNNGVSDENCFHYQGDTIPCEEKDTIYSERIYVSGCTKIPNKNSNFHPDSVKKYLIKKGPMLSGFISDNTSHAMVLVGYKTLQAGDTVGIYKRSHYDLYPIVIPNGDSRIRKTYWIFKNSWGTGYYYGFDGYTKILFTQAHCMHKPWYLETPVTSINLTDNDIVCEDLDGDGYFNWGIGPKPPHCPAWASDEPDGDDSDYSKGPLDELGFAYCFNEHINDTIYINNDTTWTNKIYIYNHVVIQNGAKLRISNDVTFYHGVSMTIRESGILQIDGGTLNNSDIKLIENNDSRIHIINNGVINSCPNRFFLLPLGNTLQFESGKIN